MRAFLLLAVVGLAVASCPNSCNGHGRCGQYDQCTCFPRWTGADCSERLCKEGFAWSNGDEYNPHGWVECSNQGICDRATGQCQCFPEYEGAACQRSSCPNSCSGHGTCELAKDLSIMPSTEWDYWKIQGCRCDGGFTGPDCSQRLCPLGDDPLTVPSPSPAPLPGQVWEFQLSASATTTTEDSYFFFEVVDLYGVTARSRTIRIPSTWFLTSGNDFPVPPYSTASFTFDEIITYAVYDMPWVTGGYNPGVMGSGPFVPTTATVGSGGANDDLPTTEYNMEVARTVTGGIATIKFAVALQGAPARVSDFRIRTDKCVDGCYPYVPGSDSTFTASVTLAADANKLVESAVCSNRGICDPTLGQCTCFTGHYGLACQQQTVLV